MPIPAPKVPTYDFTLPVSKKTIKFRPFLVKEEKILLLSTDENETDMMNGIKQVLESCTFNQVDMNSLPIADMELLFIEIRKRSIGEIIESVITCPACDSKIDYNIDLNKAEVVNEVKDVNLKLGDDLIVTMKYPSYSTRKQIDTSNSTAMTLSIISSLIVMITMGDQIYEAKDFTKQEMLDWLDNLDNKQIKIINKFLEDLPKVAYADQIRCTCGQEIPVYMEGLESFFL